MKWKNIFSLPKRKKLRKKVLDQLSQPDSPIDANEITGGTPNNPGQIDVGWLKSEASNVPKA